jgi:mannose-6-phosphate isomerase-like protein (cupin superfamily)
MRRPAITVLRAGRPVARSDTEQCEADAIDVKDPVNLDRALASFDDPESPGTVSRVNDYDVRIAHVAGEHVWHVHEETDEILRVLNGRYDVALRVADGVERTVVVLKRAAYAPPGDEPRNRLAPPSSICAGSWPGGGHHSGATFGLVVDEHLEDAAGVDDPRV